MNINFSFRTGLLSISGKIGLQVDVTTEDKAEREAM